jgi:hypothetical protein
MNVVPVATGRSGSWRRKPTCAGNSARSISRRARMRSVSGCIGPQIFQRNPVYVRATATLVGCGKLIAPPSSTYRASVVAISSFTALTILERSFCPSLANAGTCAMNDFSTHSVKESYAPRYPPPKIPLLPAEIEDLLSRPVKMELTQPT